MVKIEELLTPGERVIKKKRGVMVEKGGRGTGDLYLTNTRLLFINKKRWALLAPIYVGALTAKDIQIPLQNITTVKKSWGRLKVQADKEYSFSGLRAGGWVDAVQQAMRMPMHPPAYPRAPQPQAPAYSQPTVRRFCPNCGRPVKPEERFCGNCGAGLQ